MVRRGGEAHPNKAKERNAIASGFMTRDSSYRDNMIGTWRGKKKFLLYYMAWSVLGAGGKLEDDLEPLAPGGFVIGKGEREADSGCECNGVNVLAGKSPIEEVGTRAPAKGEGVVVDGAVEFELLNCCGFVVVDQVCSVLAVALRSGDVDFWCPIRGQSIVRSSMGLVFVFPCPVSMNLL